MLDGCEKKEAAGNYNEISRDRSQNELKWIEMKNVP